MYRMVMLTAFALIINTIGLRAQDVSTRFTKQHMKQIVESLADALEHESAGVQASAAQAIRQLEWEFPYEPLSEVLEPLIRVLKNNHADTRVRILSAIALDGLHTDTGDAVIEEMAKLCPDKSVMELCSALIIKNDKFR
jgi:HEAT repeat protein